MKKLIIAIIFVANVVLLSSCHRDRCPALGEATPIEENSARS